MKENKKNVSFQNEELQKKVKELIERGQKLNKVKPLSEAFKKNPVKDEEHKEKITEKINL